MMRSIGINVKQIYLAMRITAAILLISSLHVTAKSVSQTITLKGKNIPLKTVFAEIKKQSGYVVLYNEDLLDDAKSITLEVEELPLLDFLDNTLHAQHLDYVIKKKTIILSKKLTADFSPRNSSSAITSPPIDVKGRVVDEEGKPLEGASVQVKGSDRTTITNANGEFRLNEVDEKATLMISNVGFETITLRAKVSLAVVLKVGAENLNEVVVNKGYYTEKQKYSVGNVGRVTSKDIEKQPVNNPLLALQGRVAGMEIVQSTGLPGSGVTVRIRGRNSIDNGNDPLYVIDGVPYSSQMTPGLFGTVTGNSGGTLGGSSGSPLNYINPGDIESIEVLKDADATAIYGTRGANGVVLITTKKGKPSPIQVDANIQHGWGRVTRFIPRLNTQQYLEMRQEAFKNDGVDVTTLTPASDNYDITVWNNTQYTDWNKELIGGTAKYSNIQLSLTGGSNNVQFRMGYNFNKQTTVFPGSFGDPKGSLSFNVSGTSNDQRFQVSLSGNYQLDNNTLPDYDLSGYTNLAPNAPSLRNSDGSLNWEADPVTGYPTWENPLAYLNALYKRRVNNLVTNASFSYELISGLAIKANTGFINTQSNETRTSPGSLKAPVDLPNFERSSYFSNSQVDSWIVEPQITYDHRISKGKISALVGTSIQQNNTSGLTLFARGFNSDLVLEDSKAATVIQVESSIETKYKYNALFGRINFNWMDKYLVNINARRDGTSRFGSDNQFANFGSVGLGWIFSKENVINRNLSFLSFGKIRASYGSTGSDQVGDYRFLNLYRYENFTIPYQTGLSLVLDGLYNKDLAWEETRKFEGGLELGFWRDKMLLSISYFRNRSSNQLTALNLPSNTGAGFVVANLDALVQNSGWEITLNSINIQTNSLKWTSSINITIPRNKLLSVNPEAFNIDKRLVGQSLSTSFVYTYAGVDPVSGKYQFNDGKDGLTFKPDTAYDPGTFNLLSQHPLNTGVEYYGGLSNTISYHGFTLDFLFQFEKRLGQINERGSYPGSFFSRNQPVSILNRWQQAGDEVQIQQVSQNGSVNNSFRYLTNSDGMWGDASYVRLKNISLAWQLPISLRHKMHIADGRIYSQAQNLFVLSSYKGSDPETRSLVSLPPLKIWTIGLQLTL